MPTIVWQTKSNRGMIQLVDPRNRRRRLECESLLPPIVPSFGVLVLVSPLLKKAASHVGSNLVNSRDFKVKGQMAFFIIFTLFSPMDRLVPNFPQCMDHGL